MGQEALPGVCDWVQLPQKYMAAPVVGVFVVLAGGNVASGHHSETKPVRPIALCLSAMAI